MALKTWDDWKKEQKQDDDFLKEVEETVKGFEKEPGDEKYEYYTKSEACGIPSLIDGEDVVIPVTNEIDMENMPSEIKLNTEDIPSEIKVATEETKITFSKETWMEIQGVGSKLAERLVENGPYSSLDEIAKVKGVGKKVLKDIESVVNQIAPWEDDQQSTL